MRWTADRGETDEKKRERETGMKQKSPAGIKPGTLLIYLCPDPLTESKVPYSLKQLGS